MCMLLPILDTALNVYATHTVPHAHGAYGGPAAPAAYAAHASHVTYAAPDVYAAWRWL